MNQLFPPSRPRKIESAMPNLPFGEKVSLLEYLGELEDTSDRVGALPFRISTSAPFRDKEILEPPLSKKGLQTLPRLLL